MAEIVFDKVAWILLAAAGIGLLGALPRQPVIVSFIAVGILAAAFFQGAPETTEQVVSGRARRSGFFCSWSA